MTGQQIQRAYRRLWEHMTAGDGYQPFGYDWPTLDITHPGFRIAVNRLRELWNNA